MMLGEKISAEAAERMGMLYKIFPDESFVEQSTALAMQLASMPTKGLAYTKLLLGNSLISNLEDQLQDEDIFQQRAAETADYKEGVKAFMEKRKPIFKGE
jgi:2-(1,2-epoxy-1,2-dihydrophenyl)acetyl-CoA isomerase